MRSRPPKIRSRRPPRLLYSDADAPRRLHSPAHRHRRLWSRERRGPRKPLRRRGCRRRRPHAVVGRRWTRRRPERIRRPSQRPGGRAARSLHTAATRGCRSADRVSHRSRLLVPAWDAVLPWRRPRRLGLPAWAVPDALPRRLQHRLRVPVQRVVSQRPVPGGEPAEPLLLQSQLPAGQHVRVAQWSDGYLRGAAASARRRTTASARRRAVPERRRTTAALGRWPGVFR